MTTRADDFSWMIPPRTMVDPASWDDYWREQFRHGMVGFVDLFVNDGSLVDAMRAHGLKTVLCVGNGVSQEARALAWAGCDVTALDLSPLITHMATTARPPDEYLAGLVGGRAGAEHGQLAFVTGDLCDAGICPGPFDVVIERRTLQLYPDDDRPRALKAVADRLATPGIFLSQCHDGGSDASRPHRSPTEVWFLQEGWELWFGDTPLTGRVAWPVSTSG